MLTVTGQVLMVLGALIFATAGVGLLRLPDLFTRISAIGTAAGVGISMLILGVVLQDPTPTNLVKGAVAILLQLITSVIGAMAIARSSVLSGHEFAAGTDETDAAQLGTLADPEPLESLPDASRRRPRGGRRTRLRPSQDAPER